MMIMRIGELATEAGTRPETIRFYERRGLLPQPLRSVNGYRTYDSAALARLRFISAAQAAGLTLEEIGSVIELRESGTVPCAHVGDLLNLKLDEIHERQQRLAALETELQSLIQRSDELDPADCTDTAICHILNPEAT